MELITRKRQIMKILFRPPVSNGKIVMLTGKITNSVNGHSVAFTEEQNFAIATLQFPVTSISTFISNTVDYWEKTNIKNIVSTDP